jgi:hypothetical protein
VLLNKTFGSVRLVWNTLLAKNLKGYEEQGKSWKQDFNTTVLKTDFDFLKEVSAASLQQKSRDLSETYKQWFNSVSGKRKGKPLGYPRFKKKGLKDSYRLPNQKFKLFQADNKIQLEKIGKVTCRYPSDMSAFNKDDLVKDIISQHLHSESQKMVEAVGGFDVYFSKGFERYDYESNRKILEDLFAENDKFTLGDLTIEHNLTINTFEELIEVFPDYVEYATKYKDEKFYG